MTLQEKMVILPVLLRKLLKKIVGEYRIVDYMNCYNIHEVVYSHNTNEKPAIDDENVLLGQNSILDFFANGK